MLIPKWNKHAFFGINTPCCLRKFCIDEYRDKMEGAPAAGARAFMSNSPMREKKARPHAEGLFCRDAALFNICSIVVAEVFER